MEAREKKMAIDGYCSPHSQMKIAGKYNAKLALLHEKARMGMRSHFGTSSSLCAMDH